MGNGQTGGRILVGNHTAVVNAGLTSHYVAFDGQNVALGTGKRIVAGRGNGGGRTANVPLDGGDAAGSDLICGGADHIQAGSQHQVGGSPARRIGVVIGVVHLCLCQVGPDVASKG